GGQSRRFQRLQRMDFDLRIVLAEKLSDAHDGPASADAGDEGIRDNRLKIELPPNLRTGRLFVGFDVGFVGELSRQKYARLVFGELFSHANAAEEAALISAYRNDLRAETFDERHSLLTHPVRHKDHHLVSERAADCRERDSSVAARGFSDRIAGLNLA